MPREIQWSKDFDKQYEKLLRKTPVLESKISDLLDQLEDGENPGSPYTTIKGAAVKRFEVRIHSLKLRVVYYHEPNLVLLVMILKRKDFNQRSIKKIENALKREGYMK